MSNPFQSYTSEIVTRLIGMDWAKSREWFRAIRSYIERHAAKPVASIYDYVAADIASPEDEETRRAVLAAIAGALRQDDLCLLQPQPAKAELSKFQSDRCPKASA